MDSPSGAADAPQDAPTKAPTVEELICAPLRSQQLRLRPWWFPAQGLREPLVFYLEASLADLIFGSDRAIIPEMEWMSQALLSVDTVDSGNLVEITIFGRPQVQNRVKNIVLSLASMRKDHHVQRAKKMKQLQEFLKLPS